MTFRDISHGAFGAFPTSRLRTGSNSFALRGRGALGAPVNLDYAPAPAAPIARAPRAGFSNPLLAAPAQDPQVLWHHERYYYCESDATGIHIRAAAHFLDLGSAPRRCVWTPPRRGGASRNVWAPELHFLDGRCYIYFAADDGRNANHRMWVLGAESNDPAGDYTLLGRLETDTWAIDGTVVTDGLGQRTFVWSGWPGRRNGRQELYASRMASPTKLVGPRVRLTTPEHAWECRGLSICEGPQVLQRGGRTFIIYSASGSWTEHYCLGMLVHEGGDMLDASSWRKVGPVFQKNAHTWGVGHCGFVTAPDGSDWILYHAKTSRRNGWTDREVRAQPFGWSSNGTPLFGTPLPVDHTLERPVSGVRELARSA